MTKKLLPFLLIFCLATDGLAASRKGVQLVLLSRWSQTSRDKFLSVAKDARAPAEIEIAFVPIFNRSKPYANAKYIVEELLKAGKRVTVAVHLAFKGDGDFTEKQLQADAATFNSSFFKDYASRVTFKLSPCLEDRWTKDTFVKRAKLVAAKLDWTTLNKATTNLQIRRSPEKDKSALPATISVTKPGGTQTKSIILQREYHGYYGDAAGFQAYSNDGVCVWSDLRFSNGQYEDVESCKNADPPNQPGKYKLTDFTTAAAGYGNAVLLWRPAYNLFTKTVAANGYVKFDKPATAASDRIDAGSFDDNEKEALKKFLGVP